MGDVEAGAETGESRTGRSLGIAVAAAIVLTHCAREARAQVPVFGVVACDHCQAPAELPSATLLQIPPDWGSGQLVDEVHVAIILDAGLIAFDSGYRTDQDFRAVLLQASCALDGGVAPLVRDIAGGHAVEWNPVIEESPTDLIGGTGCSIGAPAARGFVIGCNVYRLDVATHPAPTLRQFLVEGCVGHADVQRLDFSVPDPDAMPGSDRDPTDDLIPSSPDGLPDTGDEVLVFNDDVAGIDAAWYRLQPAVHGSQ